VFDNGATEAGRTIKMQPQALAVTSEYLKSLAPAWDYQPIRDHRKAAWRVLRVRLRRTIQWIWNFCTIIRPEVQDRWFVCVEVRRLETQASAQNQFPGIRARLW